jgi:hypothetical protein
MLGLYFYILFVVTGISECVLAVPLQVPGGYGISSKTAV